MNLEKLVKYVCIVFVLLFIQVGVFALQAIDPKTFPESPVEYSLGASYQFNITCNDSVGDLNAWLMFNGAEYSMNNQTNEFYKNLIDLAAGTYLYNFTCSNTTVNVTSNTWNYVVEKVPTSINLKIDEDVKNKSFNLYDNVTFTAEIDVSGLNVSLTSNYPDWEDITNKTMVYSEINLTSLGFFNITAFSDGNENYSSSSKTLYFDTIGPTFSDIKTSDNHYDIGKTYQLNVTVQDATLDQVWFESNHTGTITNYTAPTVQSEGNVYWIELNDLAAGEYQYRWIATDSLGTINSTNLTFTVEPKPVLTITADVSHYNSENWIRSNITCWSNDSLITNDKFNFSCSEPFSPQSLGDYGLYFYVNLAPLNYLFSCMLDDSFDQNYTTIETYSVTIEDVTPSPPPPSSPPSSSLSASVSFSGFKDLTVKAGKTGSITFLIKNTFSTDKTDVQLNLSGSSKDPIDPVKEGWCSLDTEKVTVPKNSSKSIKLTCKVPTNAKIGKYSLNVKAIKGKTVLVSSSAKLIVEEAPSPTTTTEEETPTGFVLSPDILPDAILVIGFLSSGLIFLFRENVTRTFKKLGGREEIVPQKKIIKPKTSWIDRIKRTYEKYNYTLDVDFRKKYQTEFFDEEDENT